MSAIVDVTALGTQWPTLDPFLFCAHHLDHYPASDGRLGAPRHALTERTLGNDFAGVDGWNMYHGHSVPGFPQHPHRGFETVTYVRRGWCDHSDSLGAQARFGEGDVQWLTAGRGIVHSEMFPLIRDDGPNRLQLFQLWLNLPSTSKMAEPYFSMLWADQIPRIEPARGAHVSVIAGPFGATAAPMPPPDSWAATDAGVEIWHVQLDEGATLDLPHAVPEAGRVLYLFEGDGLDIDGAAVGPGVAVVVDGSVSLRLSARHSSAECLVLSGRPIDEPVAQYGPFVMNEPAEVDQAIADYRATGFGGWPWPHDGPVHGLAARRFVRHPDARLDQR